MSIRAEPKCGRTGILAELKALANPARRATILRFFKCGKGQYGQDDRFLGVMVPQVRAIVRRRASACSFREVERLLASPFHEARLAGLLVLCYKAKLDETQRPACVACYLRHTDRINNWDLVDLTAYELLGNWLLTHDRAVLYELAAPDRSLWENRIAIVTTMQFIRHGQFADTFALADCLLKHPHDLIHKAVGWLLREVGKRDRAQLEAFLAPRRADMPRTMLRYAIERFPEPLRQRYLKG